MVLALTEGAAELLRAQIVMRFMSRHWLAGPVLALALLFGGIVLPAGAQPPLPGSPQPSAIPQPRENGPAAPSSGPFRPDGSDAQGLMAARTAPGGIQRQGDLMRMVRKVPGDAKPIVLEADEIFTWNEDGKVVFLLTGKVLVQQSVLQARLQQCVCWVDLPRFQQTGILHVDLYAEGDVRIDTSVEVQDGVRALMELETRGEFRLRGGRGKLQRAQRDKEPIVQRARTLNLGPARIQRTSATTSRPGAQLAPPVPTAPPAPVPGAAPTERTAPSLLRPTSFLQPAPSSGGSAASDDLVLVQAIEPAQAPTTGPRSPAGPGGLGDSGKGGVRPSFPSPSPSGPPGPDLPAPMPAPLTLPVPPGGASASRSDRQPSPGPATMLPAPTPLPQANPVVPLPPPSQVVEPPRPGQLPRTTAPGQPMEYRVLPRTGELYNFEIKDLPGGNQIITVTGGLILNIRNVPKVGVIDAEADRAVIWVKNTEKAERVAGNLRSSQGEKSNDLEFYMAGHVVLRSNISKRENTVLEADELYYDAKRNVAVAICSRLEMRTERTPGSRGGQRIEEPLVLKAPELFRTGPNTYEVKEAEIFSSKLPSDPGLKLLVAQATLTNSERPRTFFGQQVFDKKGNPVMIQESIIRAKEVVAELEDVPFFYTPYLVTDARDPVGPLETINFGVNRVYGVQTGVGLNGYKLFGLQPAEETRWRILTDYMSRRGPALGTNFSYNGKFDSLIDPNDPYNTTPYYDGELRLYGIHDDATDILGPRPPSDLTFQPPGLRGRAIWRQGIFDLPSGLNIISQMSFLSDRNFLEQYFKREFDSDPNQANFVYVKEQLDNWALAGLGQIRTSPWITTTEWLPRGDAYLQGQDWLNGWITTNTQVSLAYARLRPSNDPPIPLQGVPGPPVYPPLFPTTKDDTTGRFAILQEIGVPLDLGAVKFVPYVKGALIEYTNDLTGNELGRAWGGFGARASLPLSRLYPDVQSDLFNVQGINHKMVFSGNYFYARANESYTRLPQLDRLNDDATEQALREFKPYEPLYNPRAGLALATSPYFDPQTYAIRRLVDNRIDTLGDVQVFQFDLRQRLQTKRGFPGLEHVVDWMVLDTSVSLFPQPDKDNFGKPYSFLEYQYVWNIGDRTTFESMGWHDPQENGAQVFTAGMYFNRPDRTQFYIGYRQIDPLQSRVVTGSVTYLFSPKYAMTASTSYDFGTQQAQTNTLVFTRTGTDLQVSLGFSYNSLQNNFSAIVEVVPSLFPIGRRAGVSSGVLANR